VPIGASVDVGTCGRYLRRTTMGCLPGIGGPQLKPSQWQGQETILSERLGFYLELLDCTEVLILFIFGHFPLFCKKSIPCLGPDLETHCQKKRLEGGSVERYLIYAGSDEPN